MHVVPKKPSTSWLVVAIIVVSAAIFGYFIHIIGSSLNSQYDSISQVDASTATIAETKIELADDAALYVPSPSLFVENAPWMYVRQSNPLSSTYTPQELVPLTVPTGYSDEPMQLRKDVLSRLRELFDAATTSGYELMVSSAYRSIEEQQSLYDEFVATRGEALASQYVLLPGASEHHTGYAVDLTDASAQCRVDIDQCNLSPATAEWIATHAPDYGFIVRYPSGKKDITGIAHEPWHLRYVGKVLARQLTDNDLTLDEFILLAAPGRAK